MIDMGYSNDDILNKTKEGIRDYLGLRQQDFNKVILKITEAAYKIFY
jgi:hypothetical protein